MHPGPSLTPTPKQFRPKPTMRAKHLGHMAIPCGIASVDFFLVCPRVPHCPNTACRRSTDIVINDAARKRNRRRLTSQCIDSQDHPSTSPLDSPARPARPAHPPCPSCPALPVLLTRRARPAPPSRARPAHPPAYSRVWRPKVFCGRRRYGIYAAATVGDTNSEVDASQRFYSGENSCSTRFGFVLQILSLGSHIRHL